MLSDKDLMKAVSRILQRSERQEIAKLIETYVDVGVRLQLDNENNQIVYGRRGTGKTHVLQVLTSDLADRGAGATVYIDARTLGSTAQFTDATLPLQRRCTALFRDILSEIHTGLLEHIVEVEPTDQKQILDLLDEFGSVAVEPVTTEAPSEVERRTGRRQSVSQFFSMDVDASGPSLGGGSSSDEEQQTEEKHRASVTSEDKVVFPTVKATLGKLLEKLDTHLNLLVDEWSSLPFGLQPYLAEFIKRTLLPDSRITIKIGALEYRSNFGVRKGTDFLGFELGSDVSTALDIDDYFVYDRNPEGVTDSFADMLFLHIKAEMPEGKLEDDLRISSGKQLASRMFTERRTFEEMVRASEGVPRDMINIFSAAYFDSQKRGRDSIDRRSVVEAARLWFEKDKAQNLEDDLHDVLRRIVDEVIGHRRARSFMIPKDLERHSVVRRLFDARVLHLMHRGYADKDNPGRRYNIYSLDYGTYVDLLNTKKEPQVELVEVPTDPSEFVVPFDDKRSIRRIVLSEEVLDGAG